MSDKFRICFGTMAAFLLGADLVLCAGLALLENPWTALGIGAALLIAAGGLAFAFRRSEELWQTVLTIALAAAGCGLLESSFVHAAAIATGASIFQAISWPAVALAAVLLVATRVFKKWHPAIFLLFSAVVGVVFHFAGV